MTAGLMAGHGEATSPHPLTVGMKRVEFACTVDGGAAQANTQFSAAFCAEAARLIADRLGVPVVRVAQAGPAPAGALPGVGGVWVRAAAKLTDTAATARASWGSDMPQRGVPASEEGGEVAVPLSGAATLADQARALARAAVATIAFVPRG